MTTVTMRVPESIAERLSSAEMRSWFVDLLRRPHPPPPSRLRRAADILFALNQFNRLRSYKVLGIAADFSQSAVIVRSSCAGIVG